MQNHLKGFAPFPLPSRSDVVLLNTYLPKFNETLNPCFAERGDIQGLSQVVTINRAGHATALHSSVNMEHPGTVPVSPVEVI